MEGYPTIRFLKLLTIVICLGVKFELQKSEENIVSYHSLKVNCCPLRFCLLSLLLFSLFPSLSIQFDLFSCPIGFLSWFPLQASSLCLVRETGNLYLRMRELYIWFHTIPTLVTYVYGIMVGVSTGAPIVQVYHEKSIILPDVSRVLACLYEKDIKFETHTASYKSLLRLQVRGFSISTTLVSSGRSCFEDLNS